jgi:hypothetical protein
MAQARQPSRGGFTPVHFWMIGFVFAWLVTTVLLVWLYTGQEDLKNRTASLEAENARLVRGGDKSLPWYTQSKSGGKTMASLCEEARRQIAILAVGTDAQEGEDYATVRDRVLPLTEQIVSDGLIEDTTAFEAPELLPALTTLYEAFKGELDKRESAEQRTADLEREQQGLVEAFDKLQAEFNETTERLNAELAKTELSRSEYASSRDAEVDGFDERIEKMRQESSRETQDQRNLVREERKRLEELQRRFNELQAKLGELQITPDQDVAARRPDGQIVLAVPGDEVVFINLGRDHHVTAGLQFEVYPSTGIPADSRPKGRIEVARIHESTAECVVVSLNDTEVVVNGDLISNPVFDASRALRFVITGEFDLDGDGRDDPYGADQIAALIKDWGGEVLNELTSRVDFVVVGYEPLKAKSVSSDALRRDPGATEQARLQQRRIDAYNAAVSTAQGLSIPILTQASFVSFLGY